MSSHDVTVAVYLSLASMFVVLELLARFSRLPVPTFGSILSWVMRHRAGQVGVVLAWWWIGWHFFAY